MRYIKGVGLLLLAACSLMAVAATMASAQELGVLSTIPQGFTSKGENAQKLTTLGGKEITCTGLTNTGQVTTKDSGEITLDFTECTTEAGKVKCKTNETAGLILLSKLTFHIVDIQLEKKLLLGILILVPVTTISCGVLKVEVKGGVIGEATEYKEKASEAFKPVPMPTEGTAELILGTVIKNVFEQKAPGDQKITECHLLETICAGKKWSLEANFGTGFESAAQVSTDILESEKEAKVHIDY